MGLFHCGRDVDDDDGRRFEAAKVGMNTANGSKRGRGVRDDLLSAG